MPKHGKHHGVKRRKNTIGIARSHGETEKIVRQVVDELKHVRRQFEYQRRMIWYLIHERGGRLEFDADGFKACLEGPDTDYIFKREPDDGKKTFALIECDEKGEPISKIIQLDQTKPTLVTGSG